MRRDRLTEVACVLLALVAGCGVRGEVFGPPPDQFTLPLDPPRSEMDILFVLDNSSQTKGPRDQLVARFAAVLEQIEKGSLPYSFHIGVITTDLGAFDFVDEQKHCQSGGDGARLQRLGKAAPATCQGVTGPFRFLDVDRRDPAHPKDNLPSGQDLATTFACMAAVGEDGCGYEQPLEATWRALRDPPNENQGFLRSDAALVVVWLSDEDDCSAPPGSDLYTGPADAPPAGLGVQTSYRCSYFSTVCGLPGMSLPYGATEGTLYDCHDGAEQLGGKLYPVQRYVDLFTKPRPEGGAKSDPRAIFLWNVSVSPDAGVRTVLARPDSPAEQVACLPPLGLGCAVAVAHVCKAPASAIATYGDPAMRLADVARTVRSHAAFSLCTEDFTPWGSAFSSTLQRKLVGRCVDKPFADANNPVCAVTDVVTVDGATSVTPIPRCDLNGGVAPCWATEPSPVCAPVCVKNGDPAQQLRIVVQRATAPPANTTTDIQCQVIEPRSAAPVCISAM